MPAKRLENRLRHIYTLLQNLQSRKVLFFQPTRQEMLLYYLDEIKRIEDQLQSIAFNRRILLDRLNSIEVNNENLNPFSQLPDNLPIETLEDSNEQKSDQIFTTSTSSSVTSIKLQ